MEVRMKHHLKLYFQLFFASMKGMMEYRVDFIVGMISQGLYQLIELIFIFIVFQHTSTIHGWNYYQILLLYGLLNMGLGYVDLFFDGLYDVGPVYVKDGSFDLILLRPIHPLISVSANSRSLTAAGYMITGFLLILFSLIKLQISITVGLIFYILFASLIGGIIIGAILALLCISSFWTINSNEICWSAFTLYRFAEYPISIYNNAIRFVLIFLVPFAFVSYFPAEFLLKKEFGMVSFLGPIVALILWIIAIKAWNFGLKHYKSSGS